MGADGFVDMLRSRTQRQLDWIKVNGSALGFVIGTVVGLVLGSKRVCEYASLGWL